MPHRNVFLAHPGGMDDEPLVALKQEVTAAMTPLLEPGVTITMTTGKEDHERTFAMAGGWPGWIQSVAEGVTTDLSGVHPRYDAVVVAPSEMVGKATAEIVQRALARSKAVFHYREGVFRPVRGIVLVDFRDLRAGWALEV